MRDPVLIAQTGHTYERAAIEGWLREHSTDPRNARPARRTPAPACIRPMIGETARGAREACAARCEGAPPPPPYC